VLSPTFINVHWDFNKVKKFARRRRPPPEPGCPIPWHIFGILVNPALHKNKPAVTSNVKYYHVPSFSSNILSILLVGCEHIG
jgi:hypothetical protein